MLDTCVPEASARSIMNPGPTVPTSRGRSSPLAAAARSLRIRGRVAAVPRSGQLISAKGHSRHNSLTPERRPQKVRRMPLRFDFGDDPEASLAFAYSPLLEAVLSLHVLTVPKHHALQHQWVRSMRSLPPALKREITALSFLYKWTLPDCILPSSTTSHEEFDSELARLRALRPELAAFAFLRPLWDHGGGVRPQRRRILCDADVRVHALRRAGTIGAGARRAATL